MGTCDILVGSNPAMDTHPVQGRVAILLGMLHAKETGISFNRLGLWLVCAFILTYFISWYMLLISAVIKTNARHYVRCSNTCTPQLFLSLFCRFMSSNWTKKWTNIATVESSLSTLSFKIRTPAYNGQFRLSRRKAYIFSLKYTRLTRTLIRTLWIYFSFSSLKFWTMLLVRLRNCMMLSSALPVLVICVNLMTALTSWMAI